MSSQTQTTQPELDEPDDIIRAEPTEQYLSFMMGDEEFAINILSVQEIRGWQATTDIPNSPPHVLGVMNLRGTISPIIDLRYCFGIRDLRYTDETVVIIISVPSELDSDQSKVVGIVVDAVSDVHDLAESDIQPSPELARTFESQYIKGLANIAQKMVIILKLNAGLLLDNQATIE